MADILTNQRPFYIPQEEDDYTCPICCTVTKYLLVIILVLFFLIIPSLMIYIGVSYTFCEDIFSIWLLAGMFGALYYFGCISCFRRKVKFLVRILWSNIIVGGSWDVRHIKKLL